MMKRLWDKIRQMPRSESLPLPAAPLVREGMRRLRTEGILCTVMCVLASLVVLVNGIPFRSGIQSRYVLGVSVDGLFGDLILPLLFFTGLFMLYGSLKVTGFLRSPAERDFYTASPYACGRLWASAAAAVAAWYAVAMGGSCLTWLLMTVPFDLKAAGVCLLLLAGLLSGGLLLFALIWLAVALTGRLTATLVTLMGLGLTLPSLSVVFHMAMRDFEWTTFYEAQPWITDVWSYVCDRYFLDFIPMHNPETGLFDVLTSGGVIAFSLLCGGVLLAVAARFAAVRTGDAAGAPFTGRGARVLSLAAVNCPPACVITACAFEIWFDVFDPFNRWPYNRFADGGVQNLLFLLLLCAAALGYAWLTACVMTFRPRQAHRAIPLTAIPLVLAFAVLTAGYLTAARDVMAQPDVEDVVSFTLLRNPSLGRELAIFRLSDTYGRTVTDGWAFTDRAMREQLVRWNNDRVKRIRSDGIDWKQKGDSTGVRIRLNCRNGQKLIRYIPVEEKTLREAMLRDKAFVQAFLSLPDPDRVNIEMKNTSLSGAEVRRIYRCLTEEYDALSDSQKLAYLQETLFTSDSWKQDAYGEDDSLRSYEPSEKEPAQEVRVRNASAKAGDYVATSAERYADTKGLETVSIVLSGYGGRAYAPNRFFDFVLRTPDDRFHKTNRMTMALCGQTKQAADEAVKAAKRNGEEDVLITAEYHSGESCTEVCFRLLTGQSAPDFEEGTEGETEPASVVDVNANDMVRDLLARSVVGEEAIPEEYARVTVMVYHRTGSRSAYTFWVPTADPLAGAAQEKQAADEAAGKDA